MSKEETKRKSSSLAKRESPSLVPRMNDLKNAEKKASSLVTKAREDRNNKLKQAKIEADKLIAKHRAEKESQYQALVQAKASSNLSSGIPVYIFTTVS